tara:strand:+ start:85 stop:393 length:309 start_codon:yes stop_codon:yes gene_type:complete
LAEQYIITVEFQLHSKEMMNGFLEHMNKNAAESLRLESGCLRFDVLIPQDSSKTIFLYEIYKSKEAFQLHLNTEHLKNFTSNVKSLVALKTVRQFFSTKEIT